MQVSRESNIKWSSKRKIEWKLRVHYGDIGFIIGFGFNLLVVSGGGRNWKEQGNCFM